MTSAVSTLCPFCGTKEADAQTGRCLKCGKVVFSTDLAAEFGHPVLNKHAGESRHSPSAAYRGNTNGSAAAPIAPAPPIGPEPPPSPSPPIEPPDPELELADYFKSGPAREFVLPESRETTAWLIRTRAVCDQLVARADKAESQARDLQAEAVRSRETAAAFTSLLGQLTVEHGEPAQKPAAAPPGANVWARTHDGKTFVACTDCGRSDRRHCANGRCRPCDDKWRAGKTS